MKKHASNNQISEIKEMIKAKHISYKYIAGRVNMNHHTLKFKLGKNPANKLNMDEYENIIQLLKTL